MRHGRLLLALVVCAASAAPVVGAAATTAGDEVRPAKRGQFNTPCLFSHRAPDDPIVSPGTPGATHMHDFIANTSTDAHSTLDSLRRARSLCLREADRSAYWVPTLYQFDRAVTPRNAQIYYRTAGREASSIVPFPQGLRVIAGDARARSEQDRRITDWGCAPAGSGAASEVVRPEREVERRRAAIRRGTRAIARLRRTIRRERRAIARRQRAIRRERRAISPSTRALRRERRAVRRHRGVIRRHRGAIRGVRRASARRRVHLRLSPGVPLCPPGTLLRVAVRFPDCWDGHSLDSADHSSHLAYSRSARGAPRACPATHATALPKLTLNVRYPIAGGPGIRLSSGGAQTAHADFVNAWDPQVLAELVRRCLNADVHCGRR